MDDSKQTYVPPVGLLATPATYVVPAGAEGTVGYPLPQHVTMVPPLMTAHANPSPVMMALAPIVPAGTTAPLALSPKQYTSAQSNAMTHVVCQSAEKAALPDGNAHCMDHGK